MFFEAKKGSARSELWEKLASCFDVTFLRCVVFPAVRVVQSTRPSYNMRVTVQESMCRFAGGLCWEVLLNVADVLQFWLK